MGGTYPWWKYINRPEPQLKELEEIQRKSNTIESSTFMVGASRVVKFGNNSIDAATILGVSHDYNKVMKFDLQDGRYFTPVESKSGKPVVVVGADIVENLFNNIDIKSIYLDKIYLRVN